MAGLGVSPAYADDGDAADAALYAAGDAVVDNNVDIAEQADGYSVDVSDTSITVPDDATDPITIDSQGDDSTDVTLGLPASSQTAAGEQSDLGGVRYDNGDDSSSTVLAKEDGSVQVATVVDSADAPHDYTYTITGSQGSTLRLEEDGSVSLLDAQGEWEAGVSAPWATDANGTAVATTYSVDGDTLTQHVDFTDQTAFPVVADPWLGIALIKKTVWANNLWKWSPTLKVYPTFWGRTTGAAARWSAWKETLQKTSRKGHPNPDTASMKNQFYCHFDIVRLRAPRKESWNLDTKLPNRGYFGFVKKGCN